jgi:hypothetical protein
MLRISDTYLNATSTPRRPVDSAGGMDDRPSRARMISAAESSAPPKSMLVDRAGAVAAAAKEGAVSR